MNFDQGASHLLVVTPVKDEIQTIEDMIDSVSRQTVPFQEWVIVDDGSTDGTGAILRSLASRSPAVTLIQKLPESERELGGHVSALVEYGLQMAKLKNWRYWAKVDADLVLDPDYFEHVLGRFAVDPRLGIASGKALLPGHGGSWRTEWTPDYFPLGMARIYRRECWQEIGGYSGIRHFDIVDVYAARLAGWRTASVPGTNAKLLRRVDARMPRQLLRRVEAGAELYGIGYHPVYFLMRAARSMWDERPLGLAGLAMVCGYLWGMLFGTRRVPDHLFRFVRREQRNLISAGRILEYLRQRGAETEAGGAK